MPQSTTPTPSNETSPGPTLAAVPHTYPHQTVSHPPRVVVIGYGFAGRDFHSYLIGITPDLVLRGVMSRDAATRQRATDELGCHTYGDFDAVLADESVDLVVLATPSSTHADLAVQAMNAGKHVVTDKAMCLSLADCDRMIATAHQNRVLLSVFQNRRWDGDFLTLQHSIKQGNLGEVRWVEMAWTGFGAWGGWRGKAAMGGGRFWDLGAHLVDQMTLLFPQAIESVYCRLHRDYPSSDVDSEALIITTFAGGYTGLCDLSGMYAARKPRFAAHGTVGTWVKYGLDPQERAMIAKDIDSAIEDPAHYATLNDNNSEQVIPTLSGRWRTYYENIADALTGKVPSAVTLPSVRRAMSVLDAAQESARTGQVVRLGEIMGIREE